MKHIFFLWLAVFLLIPFTPALAQSAKPRFQPGEWHISSTVTTSMGRTVHYQESVCAKNPAEAWQTHSSHQTCDAPVVTAITGGYNIKLNCTGGTGPVQWKSVSDINETFSNNGGALEATGSTQTAVSYAGHAPIHSTATVHSTGTRTGACK